MSTLSNQLRQYAFVKGGVPNFWWMPTHVQDAVFEWKDLDTERWLDLTLDERCMFLLFVAEALETE